MPRAAGNRVKHLGSQERWSQVNSKNPLFFAALTPIAGATYAEEKPRLI